MFQCMSQFLDTKGGVVEYRDGYCGCRLLYRAGAFFGDMTAKYYRHARVVFEGEFKGGEGGTRFRPEDG